MPGRATPPIPESVSPQWAINALTSVPWRVAGAGMHDEAGGLVDDDERVVLIEDVERDLLAFERRGCHRRELEGEAVARFDPICHVLYGRAA